MSKKQSFTNKPPSVFGVAFSRGGASFQKEYWWRRFCPPRNSSGIFVDISERRGKHWFIFPPLAETFLAPETLGGLPFPGNLKLF